MKLITIPKQFKAIDGRPFQEPKRDSKGEYVLRKDKDGKIVTDNLGNPLADLEDADFLAVLRNFLNSMFAIAQQKKKELKIEDSADAVDIIRATRVVSDGILHLEDAPYKWLMNKVDEYGVDTLGVNAAILKEALAETKEVEATRAEKRREEKSHK